LGAERLRASAKFEGVHIPLKGGPEALTEVIAQRADFYFCPLGTALPLVREGTVQALAVSSPKRLGVLPEVPSTIEAGFADSDYTFWVGVFVPARTPRDIVSRLHEETEKALLVPAIKERVATLGALPMVMTPEEFDAHVKKEIVTSAALAKAVGLKPN
jgi:tripartite-type tricarboxylate transporter receptor subunit TctC